MSSNSERVIGPLGLSAFLSKPTRLFDAEAIRSIEQTEAKRLQTGALMERAGLAVAQLALALKPHAKDFWIPCGPGNNGGDGYVAARILHQWGKNVSVSCLFDVGGTRVPPDAMAALQLARQAQVRFMDAPPSQPEVCIDAIFGIGQIRAASGSCNEGIALINSIQAFKLSIDMPSGLNANTGEAARPCVKADATLTMLGLKPGLFTGDGRDHSGEVWLNDLDVRSFLAPVAHLNERPKTAPRKHNSHKGTYGNVCVIGGAQGMTGAAILAATAALNTGAGRVSVGFLADAPPLGQPPELMVCQVNKLAITDTTVVAGCGGGTAIGPWMATILKYAEHLVLDADALNAIANSWELCNLLQKRNPDSTVLTPHPLEAARLLDCSTNEIQRNRLLAAQSLTNRFNCTTVLKGSGTVISAPGHIPHINPTGNAHLATAGTGDVLAGMVGAYLAAGETGFAAACKSVYRHGEAAENADPNKPLTAYSLCTAL